MCIPAKIAVRFATAIMLAVCDPVAAEDITATLKKIKDTGQITLGVRESSIPFSYLDNQLHPVGYAIEICFKIVDAVKQELHIPELKVQTLQVTSSTRIPLMANGTIDLECGSTTNNAERQTQVSFTNTYYLATNKFVSKKISGIRTIDDLKGRKVVATAGTINVKELVEANAARHLNLTIMAAKDHSEGFLMVETDHAAAFVEDDVIVAGLAASSKQPDAFVISEETFSLPRPYSIMLRRGDEQFKAFVDRVTANLYRSAAGKELYERWFTQPIPPLGLNLNLPMSASLARAFQNPSDTPDPSHYVVSNEPLASVIAR
jgi:glutamate/aspartate transport system substrate-binding protein